MKYISLFSGAGISDVGFDRAGWECLAQVEIDKQANDVRKRHFLNVDHYEDIRSFDATEFLGRVDAVVGGFPCQDYSVAGQRGGLAGDRGALWWEFHRVVREARTELVVGENVPGLLSSGGGRDFGAIVESLVELGYRVAWRVLDLRYFGVPQRRRRVFIVASLGNGRAAEILFEPESLQRHPAESREAGKGDTQDVAGSLGGGSGARGFCDDLNRCGAFIPEVAPSLTSTGVGAGRTGNERNELDFCVAEPFIYQHSSGGGDDAKSTAQALRANAEHSYQVVAEPIPICDANRGANADADRPSFGEPNSPMYGLQAGATHGVAEPIGFPTQGINSESECVLPMLRPCNQAGVAEPVAFTCSEQAIRQGWRVRRLTPVECERLMGLPDGYTEMGASGKQIADGPRYRMLGNGWAVPQAEWIARRALAKQV